MKTKVFFIFKLLADGIRNAADAKLKAIAVINEGSAVFAYGSFNIRKRSRRQFKQRFVYFNKIIKFRNMLNGSALRTRNIFVYLCNFNIAVVQRAFNKIHACSE